MDILFVSLISIVSAMVGGLIAGFFSLKATKNAHENLKNSKIEEEKRALKSLLQALHDEIETVWGRYMAGMGKHVETLNEGEPLLFLYPVSQDYFTIYSGNSNQIGRIDDHDLRKGIVMGYTKGKAMIDSYQMNNNLVMNYEHFLRLYKETGNENHKFWMEEYFGRLINFAQKLVPLHFEVKSDVENLLRILHKKGVLTED